MITVRFEGGKELAAALAGLSARVSKSIVKEVLMDAAEPMRKAMASNAAVGPVAPHVKDNIIISAVRAKRDEFGDLSAQSVAVGPAKYFAGARSYVSKKGKRRTEGGSYQAYLLEWGTAKTGAQPFMRPAFDQTKEATLADIGRRLWVELAGRGVKPGGGLL